MKKYFSRIFNLAALVVAGTTFVACGSDDDMDTPASGKNNNSGKTNTTITYQVNLNAGLSGQASRRALSVDGNDYMKAYWLTSDKMYVFDDSWNLFGGSLSPTAESTSNGSGLNVSPIAGTLNSNDNTAELAVGSTINLLFPRSTWDYTGQDGTLATLAKKYDYATASTKITEMNGTNITGAQDNPIPFTSQQAIVKFVFQDQSGAALNLTKLEIFDSNNGLVQSITDLTNVTETKGSLTVSSSSAKNEWFVAMRGVTSGSTLSVLGSTSGSNTYYFSGELTSGLENGKYYVITFKNKKIEDDALTVEAITDNTFVDMNFASAAKPVTCKVLNADNSLNNVVVVNPGERSAVILSAGQKVLFYGENDKYTTYSSEQTYEYAYDEHGNIIGISQTSPAQVGSCNISTNKDAYLYNNIMSLCNGEGWATADNSTLRADAAFAGLFKGVGGGDSRNPLKDHPTKPLVLPATNLTKGCYQQLLMNTKFANAPELPATTLKDYCYSHMFYGTLLTKSPVLAAETLAKGCYNYMFSSCGNLNEVRCYAKTLPANDDPNDPSAFNTCSANWMQGVSSTGTFYMNSSFTQQDVDIANYFVSNPTATSYEYNGRTYQKADYMGTNTHVCWSIGTGGIHEGWTVSK